MHVGVAVTDQVVCVRTFGNRQEAELARGALEANGIEATVAADDAGGELPGLSIVHGVGLYVREGDLEAAQQALEPTQTESGVEN
jgi:hypothetical protein